MLEPTTVPITDEQLTTLITFGVSQIPVINKATLEHPDLRELGDKQSAVAFVCYAASLCKLTKLNLHDALQLMLSAYQNVEITRPDAAPLPEA